MPRPNSRPDAMLGADIPLHHQVYLHLRAEIDDGAWAGRDDFPGEIDVARRFGVSVITSRRALNRLAAEGYIERGRGRRTRVTRAPAVAPTSASPPPFQVAPGAPRPFTYEVLARGVDVAPAEACAAFGVPAGTRLWLCSRLRSFQGRPHSVTLNVQDPELGARLPLAKLRKLPMTQILREAGVRFARLTRRVGAALPPPQVAARLGLTLNDATLVYTFTHHDARSAVVQWVRIWVRGDEPSPEETFDYKTGTWSTTTAM